MAIQAAREIKDWDVVLVGVGLPNIAANFAKRVYSPNLTLVYESGSIDCFPKRQPLSIGDPSLSENVFALYPLFETFSYLISGGRIDVGYLGAAQVDGGGRLNTTVIGSYDSPKVRLPGSGGACEIMSYSRKSVVLVELNEEKFRYKVDFTTSSILSTSPRTGEEVNQRVKQSEVIVTDKCIIKIAGSGVAEVTSVYEGVDVQELRKLTERICISFPEWTEMIEEPSNEEIELLKGMDPSGAYLR